MVGSGWQLKISCLVYMYILLKIEFFLQFQRLSQNRKNTGYFEILYF